MKDFKKEYDAFGPWILQIKSQEEIPRIFDAFIKYEDSSDFYKIPRDITRREAKPGDALYRILIAFSKEQLIFLENDHNSVIKRSIPYHTIQSIQNRVDLLNGTLIIKSHNTEVKIPYNAVSSDLIIEVVFKLRLNYNKYFKITNNPLVEKDHSLPQNYFYKGILSKMRTKEEIFVLDAQETFEINKKENRWYDHLIDLYNPMIFQKIMFLTNNKELIIISRKNGIKRKRSSDYSHIHTYIPLKTIESIVGQKHETYESLYQISISFSSKKYTFYSKNKFISELLKNYANKKTQAK